MTSVDHAIPSFILKRAKGICFLTIIKTGVIVSVSGGMGVVMIKQKSGNWSGPASVGIGQVGFGFQFGASKIDLIIVLNTDLAVKQFLGRGQLRVGGQMNLSLGPIGRDARADVGAGEKGVSALFSYSMSKGLFAGAAFEGTVIATKKGTNAKFYGEEVDCEKIL